MNASKYLYSLPEFKCILSPLIINIILFTSKIFLINIYSINEDGTIRLRKKSHVTREKHKQINMCLIPVIIRWRENLYLIRFSTSILSSVHHNASEWPCENAKTQGNFCPLSIYYLQQRVSRKDRLACLRRNSFLRIYNT